MTQEHSPQLRWYNRDVNELTPFAQVLVEWMREQQIVAQSEAARRLGIKQQAVSEFLKPAAEARVPRPRVLQRISRATGIPLATLYLAAGVPLYDDPDSLPPSPGPRYPRSQSMHSTPAAGDVPDMWAEFYRRIDALHLPRETRDALIDQAEDIRRGTTAQERARIAEHTVVDSTPQPPAAPGSPEPAPIGCADDDPA